MGSESEVARKAYEFLTNDQLTLDNFIEIEFTGMYIGEIRRLAATYLPPEHREVIADRLGCSDVPDEFWRRFDPDGPDFQRYAPRENGHPVGALHCDCGKVPELHLIDPGFDDPDYYAGLCQSDDGLSGCLTVWWTRREDTPLYDHDEEARGYAVMD